MNFGALNFGAFELVVSAVAIAPGSHEPADAKIRNRIVPSGGTLVADAETVTEGLAGVDLDGAGVPERAGLGVAGGDEGEPCR